VRTAGRAPGIARKLLVFTVPATVVAALLMAVAIEIWVRATWEPRKGTPGFFLADARRGLRLAPNYDGWFAGVPVHINSLELRASHEYPLVKKADTFRILMLGDSVTFGHGSVAEHTYPRLVEDYLRAWRPDVDWQVWNAAVPGYNTSQELAHLLEVGPRFQPDLVIVGFFENDLIGNYDLGQPGAVRAALARAAASAKSLAARHLYSLEFYKKVYLQIAWRLLADNEYRLRIEHLATQESLISLADDASVLPQQALTPFERLSDEQVRAVNCIYGMKGSPTILQTIQHESGYAEWAGAIRGFQRLHAAGTYRIVFFLNDVPPVCPDTDVFYDGGSKLVDAFYLRVMSDGTPAVSSYDAFRHVRPSQMPNASAHSIGNSNAVKAEVLFTFLREQVLPAILSATLHARAAP